MKKCILVILSFVLSYSVVVGQKNVTLGKPYEVIDAESKYYFPQGNEILTVKVEGKNIMIQKLNSANLSFIKGRSYNDFPKGFQIEKITRFQDRYYFFYSDWDGNNEQLFSREIDFKDGSLKAPQKVLSVNQKLAGSYERRGFISMGVTDKFDFFFAHDSSTMVIQYRLKPETRNDALSYDIIGMHVFDKTMKQLWGNRIKMPYTEKKMNNLDYSVDSKGNVYIVTSVYNDDTTDDKKRKDDDANYHLELMKVAAPDGKISITKADVGDKFVKTLWLYESPKGYMVCAGFYNNGRDYSDADGIMVFKLGPDGKMFDLYTNEIPVSILNQYASVKTQKKNMKKDEDERAEFDDLNLREVFIHDDGSLLLIGEQSFVQAHTTYRTSATGGGSTSTYYSYHYNDMLVTKINPGGKLEWMKKLPKRQRGANGRGGMSYKYMKGQGEHILLYLDNDKNNKLPITEVPAQHADGAGGFLTAYKINDGTGETTKISILDTRNINDMEVFQFSPSRIMPVSGTAFVFEVYKKKKEDILIRVNLAK